MTKTSEPRRCVKVEVAVLASPSLISLIVHGDVNYIEQKLEIDPAPADSHTILLTICVPCGTHRVRVQRCFTTTEIVGAVRDGKPKTVTFEFTQLLRSDSAHRTVDEFSSPKLSIVIAGYDG